MRQKEKKIAEMIKNSRTVVVLTGAGISTESGIPDFRSKKEGLWNRFDSNLLSTDFMFQDPHTFYEMALAIFSSLKKEGKIKPNRAHEILAKMEKEGWVDAVITQNIDGLHRAAGSKKLYEVHGNLNKAYCSMCNKQVRFYHFYRKILKKEIPPSCPSCKGILRTSVVLFGDALQEDFYQARTIASSCDLMIVVGSSLEVSPVNMLPSLAERLVIINREETAFDSQAALVLHQNASSALETIDRLLENPDAS